MRFTSHPSMEERKFVCKYCSKTFPCGKSLGGHIRTHMNEERSNAGSDNHKLDGERKRKRDLWSETGVGNSIYGLRENPKKTIRFVHSNVTATLEPKEKFCKECGKGFPSLKALCGHMACHSEKEKGTNKFENGGKQKLVMDSQSDTETCTTPTHPWRSKTMRFKTLTLSNHLSSSVSEVEQVEEEVARCLMLLSNDSSHKGRFASARESGFVDYDVESRKMLSRGRSKCTVTAIEKSVMEDLDYDRTGGTRRRIDFTQRAKHASLSNNFGGISGKNTANGFTNDEIYENGRKGWKYERLASERDDDSYDSTYESEDNSSDTDSFPAPKSHKSKALNGKKSTMAKKKLKSKKSREHECPICFKIFLSGQALGGHKRSHFVGGSEQNTPVIKQDAPAVPCLIDLNLPAPVDE